MAVNITVCSSMKSASPSVMTPVRNNASAPAAGISMAAAISLHARQPWPRIRIQATMGTVIHSAISTSWTEIRSGRWATRWEAAPRAMPTIMAATISR
jgi:hypothetical protein